MINHIHPIKATILSVSSALFGSFANLVTIDVALQRGAYGVAIISGIIAIINGVRPWVKHWKK